MFRTVRRRLVSGSSPEDRKLLERTEQRAERRGGALQRLPDRSSMDSWLLLVRQTSPPMPPEPVSGLAVPSPSVWDLGTNMVEGIREGGATPLTGSDCG